MDFLTSVLCLLFVWTLVRALISTGRRRATVLPPGPVALPVVGNLFNLGRKPHVSLAKLSDTYGPIMTLQLGHTTTVIISNATVATQVFQKQDLSFSSRTVPDAVTPHQHHQLSLFWLPVSSRWRNLRKICNSHIFSAQRLDASQHLRHRKVEELLAEVGVSCRARAAVDLKRVVFRTSLNLLSKTIFSVDLAADPSSYSVEGFQELVEGAMEDVAKPNLVDYFPVLRKIDPQGFRRRMTVRLAKMFRLFDYLIDQRLNARKLKGDTCGASSTDMLDCLLSISEDDNSTDQKLDRIDIQHLILDLFIAGSDTTSITLEWAMAEVLRNPEILAKAQAELWRVIGKGNPVQESDISRLPYLQAVVKETFRLHPPGPLLIPRKTETDLELCGFSVPKQAQVLVNVWAIGRDHRIWANPYTFAPERFLGSEIDVKGHHFELIPFGAGRRICPGIPLATRMVHLMLASLIHSFGWKLEDGTAPEEIDMEEKFGLTLQKAKPLRAVPLPVQL